MAHLTQLRAADLRRTLEVFAGLLSAQCDFINQLNVYPVPDGDTGTNMALTMATVLEELAGVADGADWGQVRQAVAHGSLMGARGNSGVILSQMLRGLVGGDEEFLDAEGVARALERADDMARRAVVRVVEGTMLTVAQAAARGARDGGDLAERCRRARASAADALARTPELLPVLAEAGVVDSGGTGLCLLYDALCHVVAGDELPVTPTTTPVVHPVAAASEESVGELRYEVMFFLDAPDERVADFKQAWSNVGDSIVVVGGDGLHNCHIHTNEIGQSLEVALDFGRPHNIRVTDLHEQVLEEQWVREATPTANAASPIAGTAVVAVVAGEGVSRIYRSLGARELVSGGQSMNPSTAELVAAVERTGARDVVLLPNNGNIIPVAREVDALVDAHVVVVETTSVVEGMSALLHWREEKNAEENATAMRAAVRAVTSGEVTRAVRDVTSPAGPVVHGDWIGLGPEGIAAVSDTVEVATNELLSRLLSPSAELVTILEGDGATPAATRSVTEFLAAEYPGVAVEVHRGDQPHYAYLVGIE